MQDESTADRMQVQSAAPTVSAETARGFPAIKSWARFVAGAAMASPFEDKAKAMMADVYRLGRYRHAPRR